VFIQDKDLVAGGFVLWQSEGDTYGDMNNAEAINY
jgi:hypothetical protein